MCCPKAAERHIDRFQRRTVHDRKMNFLDYGVFLLALLLSTGIGLYYAWKAKTQVKPGIGNSETAEFLVGGRNMPVFPVALSVLTSFLSGIALLGIPAEIFFHGTRSPYLSLSVSAKPTSPHGSAVDQSWIHRPRVRMGTLWIHVTGKSNCTLELYFETETVLYL